MRVAAHVRRARRQHALHAGLQIDIFEYLLLQDELATAARPEPDDDYPVRRIVPAAGRPAPATTAVRSIFDLAAIVDTADTQACTDMAPPYAYARAVVDRTEGITRCTGSQYPNNRWTEERAEQERQRRARQKPPRPPKQTFRIGGK